MISHFNSIQYVFSSIESWRAFYVFYAILESTITALIGWHAFKWQKNLYCNPKQTE